MAVYHFTFVLCMVIINKIVPVFIMPVGLSLILFLTGMVFRRRLLIGMGVLVLGMFSLPVAGDALMRAVEGWGVRVPLHSVQKKDAIVVLSGMLVQTDGAALGEWSGAVDRFEGGIELFKAGKAPLLVFTRGQVPWATDKIPEGDLLAKRAILLGIPETSIGLTDIVANTAEEAVAVGKLQGFKKGERKKIILVTSAFHMRRAAMLFERAGFEVERYPVDFQSGDTYHFTILSFLPDAGALDKSSTALRELIGYLYYWVKG
jgi:uncharacterized SAM-binding protein YcdF (DUF218 family)